uniref:TRPM SLOG domain-containing protein n=1 Tax=Biomphalaria glabrata TaxID=6526 RepID=A0A2C9KDE9_BIOGL
MTSGSRIYPSNNDISRNFGMNGPSLSKQSASSMMAQIPLSPSKQLDIGAASISQQRKPPYKNHIYRSKANETDQQILEDIHLKYVEFIKRHFHQKECSLFIPIPGQCGKGKKIKAKDLKCHCGEVFNMHAAKRFKGPLSGLQPCPKEFAKLLEYPEKELTEELPESSKVWNADDYFATTTTNAFGKIDFNVEQVGGKKPSKYIRLTPEDSVDHCIKLLTEHWHMMNPEPPNLVISVVGGAKNFKLDGRMRDTFSIGLIKAAKTTNAWMITSGFNMGVMKAVGQAVHEGQSFRWDNDTMSHVLRCIGIAPWGYIKGRKFLESSTGMGKFNAYYRTSNQIHHKQPVPLNPYHTHFIFVDDGYRGRYGGVAEFRSKFERKIAAPKSDPDGGLGIPLVLLLVEGGTDAIQDVSVSLAQGIPVVVCAGTGRAADILAYAYKNTNIIQGSTKTMSDTHQDKLARKIYAAYKTNLKPGKEKEELENLKDTVIGCCQRDDLMIIFNMNKHEDLDLAILSVLLKVKSNASMENQLNLALTWNRADIAQEEIFREDVIWPDGSLENFLTQALLENKVDFVKLILNNGIIMQEYLTVEQLQNLYNAIPKHSYLYLILKTFAKDEKFNVDMIGKFIENMIDIYDHDITKLEDSQKKKLSNRTSKPLISAFQSAISESDVDNKTEVNRFKRPYKQLLVWALLMNRCELALLFWELGSEPITSALICTAICEKMEFKVPKYLTVVRNSFHEMKNKFEQLAIAVLDECHTVDPDKAISIVQRNSPTWSGLTCLQISASSLDRAFVSSVACQNSINNIWKSGIVASWPKVFLGAICPLYIFKLDMEHSDDGSKFKKIVSFYSAPLTKFSMYTASYFCFLILFTYMVLMDFHRSPTASEYILFIWIVSYFIGSIHAFIVFPSPTIAGKFRDYFGVMDRLEFVNLLLAIIGFIVRWSYEYDGKVIYCVNAVVFYICVMKLYTANRSLGPKIYMIKRMLLELAMFVMILMVFLLAYGVASQGLLYKTRKKEWIIMKDILYFPYWQLFGELFLDELETDTTCTDDLKRTLNMTSIPDDLNTCRTYNWLVPLLLAFYLLIGNVLLLNLLIAIFSHVFDTVEKNAIEIWKFQMYFLVMEFHNRPMLFPPFSIIPLLLTGLRALCSKIFKKKKDKSEKVVQHTLEYLSLFEKEMMANKQRATKANIMQSLDMKFNILQSRLDDLTRIIEDDLMSEHVTPATEPNPSKPLNVVDDTRVVEENDSKKQELEQDAVDVKRKHKHKKKKKKRKDEDRKKDITVIVEEVNLDNPHTVKPLPQIKEINISHNDNQSTPNHQPEPQDLGTLSSLHKTSSVSSVLSPGVSQNVNFIPLDSDEEEIPSNIYSPRASLNIQRSFSPAPGSFSDESSGNSHRSTPKKKHLKTRHHLSRLRSHEEAKQMYQKPHFNNFSQN